MFWRWELGLAFICKNNPQPKRLRLKRRRTPTLGDAVKEGVQKVDVVAADLKSDIVTGMDKTKDFATNVVADVKAGAQKVHDVTTNAVGEVKEKIP